MRSVPGDIVGQMLGQTSDPTAALALRSFFGLDQPIHTQFLVWLSHVLQGDLGKSWYQGQTVTYLIAQAFSVTFEVALLTLFIATVVGVPLGVIAGIYEGSRLDAAIQAFNLIGLSAPIFWVGLLPVLSLAFLQAAAYSHFVRDCMISELRRDYIRAAVAKGLKPSQIYFKHALRNILIPLITFMGLILIQILGGTVVIESLFSLPGLGRLILSGIQGRDYPVVQGALLFVVVIAICINFTVDLMYVWIDPRMRT